MSDDIFATLRKQKEDALKDAKTKPGAALKAALKDLPVREKNVGKKPEKKEKDSKKSSKKTKKDEEAEKAEEAAYKEEKKQFEKKVQEARAAAAECVLSVLCSIETAKLAGAIKELNEEERDTLMKYVYRGFSERTEVEEKGVKKNKATYDCNILLKAHEEIIKIAGGNGPIIRTIHTRLDV